MTEYADHENREGPRRSEDFARLEDLKLCVKKSELEEIIKFAVREALDSYQHKCIMDLRTEDSAQMRDLIGAIKEVGDGDMCRAIVRVRDNHKFMTAIHAAAGKIGWSVIILTVSVMGTLGVIAFGAWKQGGN